MRHKLTEETWNKLAKKKGIGMNEVAGNWGYRGLEGTTMSWKANPSSSNVGYGQAWNDDYVLIGSSTTSLLNRGDGYSDKTHAGVLYSSANGGVKVDSDGFRPVLAF